MNTLENKTQERISSKKSTKLTACACALASSLTISNAEALNTDNTVYIVLDPPEQISYWITSQHIIIPAEKWDNEKYDYDKCTIANLPNIDWLIKIYWVYGENYKDYNIKFTDFFFSWEDRDIKELREKYHVKDCK